MQLPSRIPTPSLKLNMNIGRRSGADVVGLDIQPGFVAAVKARVNGSILAEQAAAIPLPADVVRDGEVMDQDVLADALRELFGQSKMNKRVRVGVANQRTVLRTLELPPVSDPKELAAAVTFQAQDQVPMPLNNAVLDFHPLGVVDTPAGPRQRVVLVAAQRDMVEKLLAAVRRAGLTPEGVDLSAFALIRSLYRADPEQSARVLYLNVDGLTNLAIAEGKICHFTRVVGSGLEGMSVELAERRGIALTEARELLAGADLTVPAPTAVPIAAEPIVEAQVQGESDDEDAMTLAEQAQMLEEDGGEQVSPAPAVEPVAAPQTTSSDSELATVLESGIREISGEVRNSLDFHRSQEGGGEVSHVILSGSAQDIPGFAQALQASLGLEVRSETIGLCDEHVADHVSAHRLAVATGLAASEVPQ
jgi:type IV pilus assembly protein PilM